LNYLAVAMAVVPIFINSSAPSLKNSRNEVIEHTKKTLVEYGTCDGLKELHSIIKKEQVDSSVIFQSCAQSYQPIIVCSVRMDLVIYWRVYHEAVEQAIEEKCMTDL
jgi:hypothetical protein